MSENSYLITLLQKENQTIIAYELNDKGEYTGVSHTESFFAKANSKWKFTVIPDKFHEDYWIHIIQSDHQTITVRDNARFHDYRAGVLVSYPDDDKLTGIQAGDLNSGIYPETNYDVAVEDPHDRYKYLVVNQNCRIFATLARDLYNNTDYHTISIKQVKHQTIVLTYRNKKYYTDTIVEDNEDYTVELIPDSGYTATSLIINGKTINSLKYTSKATEDLAITAAVQSQAGTDSNYLEFIFKEFDSRIERFNNSDGKLLVGTLQVVAEPEIKTYRVSIVQSTNQTIHVYVPQKIGGTDHTSSFNCPEGTKYEVEVIADNGYTAGIPNTKGGIVNRDITINASPATKSNVTITIIQSANQTIHIYTPYKAGGIDHTSTFTVDENTTYEAEVIGDSGYLPGDLGVGIEREVASKDLRYIYLYKKNKIKTTPLLFGHNDNLFVSSLYDPSNIIYSGNTNNPKLTNNKFIQPEILKYYGFDYLFGYFDELEGSSISSATVPVKNSNYRLTIRLLGFNLFKMSKNSNKKTGRWVIGFNKIDNLTINSITMRIADSNGNEIAVIKDFRYLNTIPGDTNNSNRVQIYCTSSSINNELDPTYLYLLANKSNIVKVGLVVE